MWSRKIPRGKKQRKVMRVALSPPLLGCRNPRFTFLAQCWEKHLALGLSPWQHSTLLTIPPPWKLRQHHVFLALLPHHQSLLDFLTDSFSSVLCWSYSRHLPFKKPHLFFLYTFPLGNIYSMASDSDLCVEHFEICLYLPPISLSWAPDPEI